MTNMRLSLRIQPRQITPQQKELLARLLKDIPRMPLWIEANAGDAEEQFFARQIGETMATNGFLVQLNKTIINADPTFRIMAQAEWQKEAVSNLSTVFKAI